MRVLIIVTVALTALTAACGQPEDGGQANPTLAATPPGGEEQAPAEGDTITGTFGGDAALEGGCVWVDDGQTRWEVQFPDGYDVSFDPLTLTGPEGQTAGDGDTITVAGTEQADAVTTCQVGPLWIASSVTFDG